MSALIDTRLGYLRYTTKMYIDDDPTTVTLHRQVKVNKPGGGHDFTRATIAAQVFRFINQDISTGIVAGSDDGTARRFSYVIVGLHDADVDINDNFTVDNIQYKVDSIVPNNGWESRAYITAFATEPEKG